MSPYFCSRFCWFVIFAFGMVATVITLISVIAAYYDYDVTTTMTLNKYTNVRIIDIFNVIAYYCKFDLKLYYPLDSIPRCNGVQPESS